MVYTEGRGVRWTLLIVFYIQELTEMFPQATSGSAGITMASSKRRKRHKRDEERAQVHSVNKPGPGVLL